MIISTRRMSLHGILTRVIDLLHVETQQCLCHIGGLKKKVLASLNRYFSCYIHWYLSFSLICYSDNALMLVPTLKKSAEDIPLIVILSCTHSFFLIVLCFSRIVWIILCHTFIRYYALVSCVLSCFSNGLIIKTKNLLSIVPGWRAFFLKLRN